MNAQEAIQNIRTMALDSIRSFLISRSVKVLDFTEPYIFNCLPQIQNGYDLDRIILSDDDYTLTFEGSNVVGDELTLVYHEIGMENLAEISDWLGDEDTAEYIDEYISSGNPADNKKEYTFRFCTKSWVDITVTAGSQSEAAAMAQAAFDSGDYDRSDEDIEDTCELIYCGE